MKWSGDKEQLRKLILAIFSDPGDLEIFVSDVFDENISEIATGNNLEQVVYRFIKWVENKGELEKLVKNLLRKYPNNLKVKQLFVKSGSSPEALAAVQEDSTDRPSLQIKDSQPTEQFRASAR